MIKKTQWKELWNSIRINKVSFLAIMVFAMFGVALYSGLDWSGEALNRSVILEQEAGHMADLEIIFPYGYDGSDLIQLQKVPGVTEVAGSYSGFQQFDLQGNVLTAKIVMLQDQINILTQIEGTLPKQKNEIAVEKHWAEKNGISIGDKISFLPDNAENTHLLYNLIHDDFNSLNETGKSGLQYLNGKTFYVTALAESCAYMSSMAAGYETSPTTFTCAECLMFAPESAFDVKAFTGYPSVLIRSDEMRGLEPGTQEYKDTLLRLKNSVGSKAEELAEERYKRICDSVALLNKNPSVTIPLPKLDPCSVTIVERDNNASLSMLTIITDMCDKLKYNLSIPFIFICILVSYSTISRTVYKDLKLIGTKKAMGFRDASVIINYILFAGIAAFLGLVLGLLVSRFVIEGMILNVLSKSFYFAHSQFYFSVTEAVSLSFIQVGTVLLSAYIAGRRTVHLPTLRLLSADTQPDGKERFYEKTFIWKHIPLFTRSVIHNFFCDKRRIVATLIGVTGSTALVICGASMALSVSNSFDYQFSELQDDRYVVYFDPTSESAMEELKKTMTDVGIACTPVQYLTVSLQSPDGSDTVAILVVSDSNFDGLRKIKSIDSGEEMTLPDNGALLSCAYAKNYGIDETHGIISFTDALNRTYNISCAGVFEFYMQCPKILISKESYLKEFEQEPTLNAFFVAASGMGQKELNDLLCDIPGFISVYDYYSAMKESFEIIIGVTSAISAVYLVLSVLIAFFILLDLFVMFVDEKKRELITLMINGYSLKYAKRYIYQDTVILTIIGIVLGVISGIGLSYWNVNVMTSDVTYFLHDISILSCVAAVLLSTVLTIFMCIVAMRKIKYFQLSDLE